MNRRPKTLINPDENLYTRSYRADFIRRRQLPKLFKGNERGYKTLSALPETIHSGMEVLWRQNSLCDVEILTSDKRRFKAHKLVLATCCDYFYNIIEHASRSAKDVSVIQVDGINGNVFETLLEAIYTGRVKIEAGVVEDILSSASSIGMFVIIDACEDFLLDHVSKDNCLQFLGTAVKYNLPRLVDTTLQISARNFHAVSKRNLFRELSVEQLIPLLKRNDLQISSELDVFSRVRSWIDVDRSSRLQYAADLMATIRLPLLNPLEMIDQVECYGYLMDIAACQKLVKECLHYHLMPPRQCLLQSPRTVPRCRSEVCFVTIGGAPRFNTEPVHDDVMKLNTETGQWELLTTLPAPRQHHAVAVLNGFLFVAGGEERSGVISPSRVMFRFDPRTNNWMETASMCTARQSFQIAVLGSCIYAVGGRITQEECLASVERYDPSTDAWQEVAPLSSPRRCSAVACLNGKLYSIGGSGHKHLSSRVECYSPAENKWDVLKPISTPRFFGHALPISGHLYLVGGATIDQEGTLTCVEDIERFSPITNQWTFVSKMRTPRSEFGCAVIKEKVYVIGGYNWSSRERPTKVEYFDTEMNTWSVLPVQRDPLIGVAAAALTVFT